MDMNFDAGLLLSACRSIAKKAVCFATATCSLIFGHGVTLAQSTANNALILDRLNTIPERAEVVIDTDTYNEIDDQFAVVYALLSPEKMKVSAMYAAPYDNNRSTGPADGMQKSYDEILRLLQKMKMPLEKIVYKGAERFMPDKNTPVPSDAARDLISRALKSEQPLYVLTLGAPTNVASAILMEPKIKEKIVVIWLGGKAPHWKTAYEFNLKQDIPASQTLFDSRVPLVQIPTEPVSSHLLTTLAELKEHLAGKNEISNYLIEIYKDYHKNHYAWAKVIWDISVVAYLINPKWMPTELKPAPILTRDITYSFDDSRHLYRVVTFIDRNKVFEDMFRKIGTYQSN